MCAECRQTPCHPRCPNAPVPKVVFVCEWCGAAIREGDEAFTMNGEYYHEECVEDGAVELLVQLLGARRFTADSQDSD